MSLDLRQGVMTLVAVAALSLSCHGESPLAVCEGVERGKATIPDTTTIKVGSASIAIAGAVWGACVGTAGYNVPPPPDFIWTTSDSSIATVTSLDSGVARIHGRAPGHAVIRPLYATGGDSPSSVTVTVVP